jgi:hypothetical protein
MDVLGSEDRDGQEDELDDSSGDGLNKTKLF